MPLAKDRVDDPVAGLLAFKPPVQVWLESRVSISPSQVSAASLELSGTHSEPVSTADDALVDSHNMDLRHGVGDSRVHAFVLRLTCDGLTDGQRMHLRHREPRAKTLSCCPAALNRPAR
jgi:hypothetical protein